jgi:flavin reductase (DIM6/NTAB) family NADH-FMN oxidoreductase RutF
MEYDPGREACPLPFSPFKSCTVPRPIGWLSTISRAGVANLAPYSQWQNLTFDPPMVMFAANRYPDGREKDTVVNARETGWFVWNMATWELRDAVNISAKAVAADVDEFDEAQRDQGRVGTLRRTTRGRKPVPLRVPLPVHSHA